MKKILMIDDQMIFWKENKMGNPETIKRLTGQYKYAFN
jgi:hypothetical protein